MVGPEKGEDKLGGHESFQRIYDLMQLNSDEEQWHIQCRPSIKSWRHRWHLMVPKGSIYTTFHCRISSIIFTSLSVNFHSNCD